MCHQVQSILYLVQITNTRSTLSVVPTATNREPKEGEGGLGKPRVKITLKWSSANGLHLLRTKYRERERKPWVPSESNQKMLPKGCAGQVTHVHSRGTYMHMPTSRGHSSESLLLLINKERERIRDVT